MVSKFRAAQLVFLDGERPVKIRRVIKTGKGYVYELRETVELIREERLSLLDKSNFFTKEPKEDK